MKIFALTLFVICLITVLSLQVESFEEKPKGKGKAKAAKATGIATCKKVALKGTTLTAQCGSKKTKNSINLSKCKTFKNMGKGKTCKLAKNVIKCKAGKFNLVKLLKFNKKGKLAC